MELHRRHLFLLLSFTTLWVGTNLAAQETPRYRNLWAIANPAFREPFTLSTDQKLPESLTVELWDKLRLRARNMAGLYDWVPQDQHILRQLLVNELEHGWLLLTPKDQQEIVRLITPRDMLEYALRAPETEAPKSNDNPFPLTLHKFKWGDTPAQTALIRGNMEAGFISFAGLKKDLEAVSQPADVLQVHLVFELFGGVFEAPLDTPEDVSYPLTYTPVFYIEGTAPAVQTFNTWEELKLWLKREQ